MLGAVLSKTDKQLLRKSVFTAGGLSLAILSIKCIFDRQILLK